MILANIPLYLNTNINDEIVNPNINPFTYIKNILIIIPIIDIPNTHITVIYITFSINEFLNASILLILLLFILVKKVFIFSITKFLSASFNTTKNIDPDIIPNIIINKIK